MTDEPSASDGDVTVRKAFDADSFPVPAITFEITSERSEAVELTLVDDVPEAFPMDHVGFHPDYDSDRWTAYQDHRVQFECTLDAGESLTTVYGIRVEDPEEAEPFLEAPSLDVRPAGEPATDAPDGEEAATTDVVPSESTDLVREAIAGERTTVPGLDGEDDADAGDGAAASADDGAASADDASDGPSIPSYDPIGGDADLGDAGDDTTDDAAEAADADPIPSVDADDDDHVEVPEVDASTDDETGGDADDGPAVDAPEPVVDASDGEPELDLPDDTAPSDVGDDEGPEDSSTTGPEIEGEDGAGADEAGQRDDGGPPVAGDASDDGVAEEEPAADAGEREGTGPDGTVPEQPNPVTGASSGEGFAAALAAEIRAGEADESDVAVIADALDDGSTSTDARVEHLQARVSDLEAYTDALEAFIDENGTARELLADLQDAVEAVEARADALEDARTDADRERERLRADLDDLADDVDAVDDLATDVDELAADVGDLEARLAEVEDEADDVSDVAADVAAVRDGLENVQDDVESLQEWRGQLTNVLGG